MYTEMNHGTQAFGEKGGRTVGGGERVEDEVRIMDGRPKRAMVERNIKKSFKRGFETALKDPG